MLDVGLAQGGAEAVIAEYNRPATRPEIATEIMVLLKCFPGARGDEGIPAKGMAQHIEHSRPSLPVLQSACWKVERSHSGKRAAHRRST